MTNERGSKKVLIILTSHERLGTTDRNTGFWLEELAVPYLELVRRGAEVDLASPAGGRPPADPASERDPSEAVRAFQDDRVAQEKLAHTRRLADVRPSDYDAYFVAGGHGVMWDLAQSDAAAKLLRDAFECGRVVAAVCHGPAALTAVRLSNGEPLVRGRRVAGFTNEEERAAHLDAIVPFSLQSKLTELGGRYEHGPMWSSFVVRDGKLVTGQNPQSSLETARAVLEALGS